MSRVDETLKKPTCFSRGSCHIFEYKAFGEFRLDPNLVEQLLAKRRQLDETKSIQENIAEHYGKRAAELAKELI